MPFTNESLVARRSTFEKFFKGVEDAITERNTLLQVLQQKGRYKTGMTGLHMDWRVRKQKSGTVKGWREYDTIEFKSEDNHDTAKLNVKGYRGTTLVSTWDKNLNRGTERIWDLQGQKWDEIADDLMEKLEDGGFDDGTGETGNKGWDGLPAFVSTTATYANISQSTNAYWQAQSIDGDAGPNTDWDTDVIERMLTAYLNAGRGGGKTGFAGKLDCWITNRTSYAKIHSAIQTNERFGYMSESKANAGFTDLLVLNIPVYWSDSATAAVVYGLNTSMLDICIWGDRLINTETESQISPLGDAGVVWTQSQMRCRSPRYQTKITNAG